MRWALVIGAVVLLAGGGFLLWELRGDGDESAAGAEPPAKTEHRARADTGPAARIPPPVRRTRIVDAGVDEETAAGDSPSLGDAATPRLTAPVAGMGWTQGLPMPRYDAGPEDVQRYRVIILKRTYREGKFEAARDLALEMIKVYPDEPQGYLHVVYAACAMGDVEMAREYYPQIKSPRHRRIALGTCRELSAPLE